MLPSKPSEKPWQVVGRGSQKSRAPLQTISNGGDRGPPATQPALRQAPNARVPQTPIHPNSAPKKEKTPYEIKNAREQDPKRRLQVNFSSASSDDDDDDDDDDDVDYCHNSDHNSRLQAFEDDSSRMADDRSHPMISKRSQLNARPRGQPSGHQRARPRVNLNYKRDNLARAAFRKRLAPTGSFTLPKDCPDIEPNQKRMYDMFEEIGVRLGSFMRPPQRVKDRELLLWGDASQVQATIAELIRRFDHRMRVDFPRKVTAKDKFARETSSIGDQHHRLMKKMQKEAKILEFQQVPAEGRVFRYTGTFLWPVDEVHPEDILGSSLEAFDSIRFHYGCHILFDNKGSFFKIFSDTDGSVKETINRIVGTMKEYLAKSVRPDTVILIEPPCSSAVKEDVKLLPVSLKGPKADSSMVPVLTGSPKPPSEWLNQRNVLKTDNNRRMEFALRKCIANLPYYRGLVRMRVQFGTFALRVFRWKEGADSTPLGEFVQNMTMSGTKALMIREYVDFCIHLWALLTAVPSLHIQKDATTIISKVQTATDLFIPMDNFSTSLEEVVPSFSACFEFSSPDSPPMNFTLELSSSPAASTIYEKVQELWTRTDRRDNAVPLEAFVVGLDRYVVQNQFSSAILTSPQWGFLEAPSLYRKQNRLKSSQSSNDRVRGERQAFEDLWDQDRVHRSESVHVGERALRRHAALGVSAKDSLEIPTG